MERKKYIEMCQKCSVLPNSLFRIKENVPDELKVVYDGTQYYPLAYQIDFDTNGRPISVAILHDLKSHSQAEVLLEKVSPYKNKEKKDES